MLRLALNVQWNECDKELTHFNRILSIRPSHHWSYNCIFICICSHHHIFCYFIFIRQVYIYRTDFIFTQLIYSQHFAGLLWSRMEWFFFSSSSFSLFCHSFLFCSFLFWLVILDACSFTLQMSAKRSVLQHTFFSPFFFFRYLFDLHLQIFLINLLKCMRIECA